MTIIKKRFKPLTLKEFRQKLHDITNENQRPSTHPRLIESLKKEYPHNIRLVSNKDYIDAREDCFSYTLRNVLDADMRKLIEYLNDKELLEKVVEKLISNSFLSLHDCKKEDDKIIVYFNKGYVKHFGEIVNRRVVSKWGRTHIYEHELFEIPLSYGNNIKYSRGEINKIIFQEIIESIRM